MSKVKNAWLYVLFAYLGLLSLGFMDNTRGAVFEDFIQTLHLTDSKAAWFFVIPSSFAFLSSLFCQKLIEKHGPIFVLRVGLIFMSLAVFSFAWTNNFYLILAETVVFGLGFGVISVAQNVAIHAAGPAHLRRQLFSGLHGMYGLASLLAPLVAGILFSRGHHWQEIFLVCVSVPMTVIILGMFFPLPMWEDLNEKGSAIADTLHDLTSSIKRRQIFLAAAMSIYLISEISVSSRLVVLVQRKLQLAPEDATIYLVAFFLCLFLSRMVFAFVSFKALSTQRLLHFCLWISAVLTALGLSVSPWFLSLSALSMAPFFPAAMDFLAERFGANAHYGMAYTMAFASLTVVGMHFSVGLLTDAYGIEMALWMAPVSLVLSSMAILSEKIWFKETAN